MPTRIVVAVAGASLVVGCSGPTPPSFGPLVDAAAVPHDAWVAVAMPIVAGDAQTDGAAPDPPTTPCDPDAGAEIPVCPTPPPVCLDSHVAVNYLGGECVSGFCTWQKSEADCREVDASCAGAAGVDGGLGDAGPDASAWVNVYGCLLLAPPAPTPPPLACDVDASLDSGVCPLPPSECADSAWLVYYDDGQCVAGSCTWQKKDRFCGDLGCIHGACGSVGTVPAPTTQQ